MLTLEPEKPVSRHAAVRHALAYVLGFAAELAAIQDPAAKAFCRRLLEVLLSRAAVAEVAGG